MRYIILIPPRGEVIADSSEEDVRAVILNSDPAYWRRDGSGDAGLHFSEDGNFIVFTWIKGWGFCVVLERSMGLPQVLTGFGDPGVREKVWYGQNMMSLPRSYFVGAERAMEAAVSFMENDGEPLPGAAWVDFDGELCIDREV